MKRNNVEESIRKALEDWALWRKGGIGTTQGSIQQQFRRWRLLMNPLRATPSMDSSA